MPAGDRPACLRFWEWSSPAVVVGRFQSIPDEVHVDEAERLGFTVVRRCTCGGTVGVQEPAQWGKAGGAAQRRFPAPPDSNGPGAVLHHTTLAYELDDAQIGHFPQLFQQLGMEVGHTFVRRLFNC